MSDLAELELFFESKNERLPDDVTRMQDDHSESINQPEVAFESILDDQFLGQFSSGADILSRKDRINLLLFRNFLECFNYKIRFEKINYIFQLLQDNWIQAVQCQSHFKLFFLLVFKFCKDQPLQTLLRR